MNDSINSCGRHSLNEKLNKEDIVSFDRERRLQTVIEMTGSSRSQDDLQDKQEEIAIRRVESNLSIQTYEEESPKEQGLSAINRMIVNFIWGIRQTLNVIIFIKKIKHYSRKYLFRSLSRQSFYILGDQSSIYDYYTENNLIDMKGKISIWSRIRKLKSKRYIIQDTIRKIEGHLYNSFRKVIRTIDPRSKAKVTWDAIVYFILTVNIFYIPIYLSWDEMVYASSPHSRVLTLILNDIPGWVFFVDILLHFLTCYYEEGKLITKRRKIFVNYITKGFWEDILIVLPFLINQYTQVKYLNVILLFRINNMIKRMNYFEEMIDLTPKKQLIYDFLKIMITIIFISHFIGCIFFFLGQIEMQLGIQNNWISYYQIPRDFFSEYVYSIYWATITMVTIGYGDITPQTNCERLFVIFIALIGCCYYAAILSFVGSILNQWHQMSQEKRKKVSVLISYLKKRGVDKMIQYKVKKQIAYLYQREQDYYGEASAIMSTLSSPLQQELMGVLKTEQYEAGDIIIDKDQINENIYCLLNGQCNLELQVQSYKTSEPVLVMETFNTLDSFGEYCFLTNKPSPGRVVAVTSCIIKTLSKSDLESVLKHFPKEHQFYRMQVDNTQIDASYKYANKKCYVCNDESHFFFKCPFTNLNQFKSRLYSKATESHSNERAPQDRARYEKLNVFMVFDRVRSSAIQFMFDNEMLDNVESIEALMGDEEEDYVEPIQLKTEFIQDYDHQQYDAQKEEKEENEIKEDLQLQQPTSIRAQTINYFMKKKKDIQAKENQKQTQQKQRVNDHRSKSFWEEEKTLNPEHLLRISYNQKRDQYQQQKDPYTPIIQKIAQSEEHQQQQIDKISLNIQLQNEQQREQQKFSPISNFDKLSNFSIYYPMGNYSEISKQKKRLKYFSKQKFKQSVEAIRKLLVFRSKMENSGAQGSYQSQTSKNRSLEGGSRDLVQYNKSMQQHLRKKTPIIAENRSSSDLTQSKPVYKIPEEKK